ncbi:hypothetical protein OC834_005779 [Tilletia horrida]|nr:hypothetical protein OC834_005779 [Tilletia horrida]
MKRIVILCDGSWQSRTQALIRGLRSRLSTQYIGNIALLAQAIKTEDQKTGTSQVTFYQDGVGTTVGLLTNIFSGATGAGLSSNLIEAYSFIVDNYTPGDELFLFGFSRGSYTARALSGFILWAGIMSKSQLAYIRPIYDAYQRRSPRDAAQTDFAARVLFHFTGRWPSAESSEVEGVELEKRSKKKGGGGSGKQGGNASGRDPDRLEAEQKGPRVVPPKIKYIGVLDTVGALGVPGQFSMPWVRRFFDFFDTGLSSNVENAYQALALSENRADFAPTLWDRFDPTTGQTMKEIWFAGSHGNVGGGKPEHGLSDIVLANLCAQLTDHPDGPLLDLDLEHVKNVQDRRKEWAKEEPYRSRSWWQGRKSRQVCRNLAEKEEATAALQEGGAAPDPQTPKWANEVPSGPNREMLHHSVVASGVYDRARSEEFATLRERDPEELERMWNRAADPGTLLPTERFLLWQVAEPDRVPPLSASWARAPARLSPAGVRRYLAFKDALVDLGGAARVWVQVVTWPLVVVLNAIVARTTSTENLAGKPPKHPVRASGRLLVSGLGKLKEAIVGPKKEKTGEAGGKVGGK